MQYSCNIYAKILQYLCNIYAILMQYLSNIYAIFMQYLCNIYDSSSSSNSSSFDFMQVLEEQTDLFTYLELSIFSSDLIKHSNILVEVG